MPSLSRPAVLAAAAAASGVALFGVAAGGVAGVDQELQAVTPAVRFQTVELRQDAERVWDCPAPRRHGPATAGYGDEV